MAKTSFGTACGVRGAGFAIGRAGIGMRGGALERLTFGLARPVAEIGVNAGDAPTPAPSPKTNEVRVFHSPDETTPSISGLRANTRGEIRSSGAPSICRIAASTKAISDQRDGF